MVRVLRIAAKAVVWLIFYGVVGGFVVAFGIAALSSLPPRWQYWNDFALAEEYIARIKAYRAQHPCYPTHAEAGIPNTESGHIFYEHGCNFFKIIVSVGFDETYTFNSICNTWSDRFGGGCE